MDKDLLKLKRAYRGSEYSRTVVVQKMFSLAFLHEVIQASFGWLNYHLYNFEDAKGVVYESDEDALDLPLDKKGRKTAKAQKCADWLDAAFGKTVSRVLREPSANEIHARVRHLHELVCTAVPAR